MTAGDGGGRRKTAENIGKQQKTAGDGGGRHNAVRPGPWLLLVRQVQEKTGRDDEMSSVLVLAQDGRTAPLGTLGTCVATLGSYPRSRNYDPCGYRCRYRY